MKFLLFADFHYYPEVFLGCTMTDLQTIQAHAEAEGCDFIIHAGDFCHGPARFPEIVRAYNEFHIPSYHCIGNHDALYYCFPEGGDCVAKTRMAVEELYKMKKRRKPKMAAEE